MFFFLPQPWMLLSDCDSKHLNYGFYCYFNNSSVIFATGNAYQLSQLIRTLLDPENMALGANVRTVWFFQVSKGIHNLLIKLRISSNRVGRGFQCGLQQEDNCFCFVLAFFKKGVKPGRQYCPHSQLPGAQPLQITVLSQYLHFVLPSFLKWGLKVRCALKWQPSEIIFLTSFPEIDTWLLTCKNNQILVSFLDTMVY